ncbi:MAG TPA: methylated-DNA--[protein]-cysteine S-methyltransferase [Caulobacteraceae bacterium]|jgi:methylated-DNA-[protein]-cysteine S-methyltransferase
MNLQLDRFASPMGELRIVFDDEGWLRALDFEAYADRNLNLMRRQYGDAPITEGKAPASIREPLEAYFKGDLKALDRIKVATNGTPFQEAVWGALRNIPAGATRSYAQQAEAIGRPKAVRAVGLANGANPIAIVNPCHRVIGKSGDLTGYGGGLERKRWLLTHEGVL